MYTFPKLGLPSSVLTLFVVNYIFDAFFSKEGSGWQWVLQGCPSSQIEKKSIKTISKNPERTNQLRTFKQIQIEKKSIKIT